MNLLRTNQAPASLFLSSPLPYSVKRASSVVLTYGAALLNAVVAKIALHPVDETTSQGLMLIISGIVVVYCSVILVCWRRLEYPAPRL